MFTILLTLKRSYDFMCCQDGPTFDIPIWLSFCPKIKNKAWTW